MSAGSHRQMQQSPPSAPRARAAVAPLSGPPVHSLARRKRAQTDKPTPRSANAAIKPQASPTGRIKANGESRNLVEKRLAKAAASKAARLDLSRPLTRATSDPAEMRRSGSDELISSAFRVLPPVIVDKVALAAGLKQLWLTNHALTALPAEIGVLRRLRVLGLGGNALSSLPPELCTLPNLECLYLERNCIQVLPASLELPRSLRDLRLDNNVLAVFPSPVTKLRLLNRLGLSHNKLRGQLPAQIGRLRNLVELDLDHNALGPTLAPEVKLLRRLERLGLEGNCLSATGIDAVLHALPLLVYVRVSGNRGDWNGSPETQDTSEQQPLAAVDEREDIIDPESMRRTAPRRHDGFFQTTIGYRKDKRGSRPEVNPETHDGEPDSGSESLVSQSPPPLHGIVPCRAVNLGNAELYRGVNAITAGKSSSIPHTSSIGSNTPVHSTN